MKPKQNYVPGPKDNCQTPGYALEPLLEVIDKEFLFSRIGWECASGEGYLKTAMSGMGLPVISSDLQNDGADFLLEERMGESYDYIITNPPFSMKKEFLYRCAELDKPFALLMPAETIANKWFIEWARGTYPQPGIIWISPRINFKMPKKGWEGSGSQFNIAWFTWRMWEGYYQEFTGNYFYRANHWTKEYRQRFEY